MGVVSFFSPPETGIMLQSWLQCYIPFLAQRDELKKARISFIVGHTESIFLSAQNVPHPRIMDSYLPLVEGLQDCLRSAVSAGRLKALMDSRTNELPVNEVSWQVDDWLLACLAVSTGTCLG